MKKFLILCAILIGIGPRIGNAAKFSDDFIAIIKSECVKPKNADLSICAIDLTQRDKMVAAISALIIATPPICRNDATPQDMTDDFILAYGHQNDAKLTADVKAKIAEDINNMGKMDVSARLVFCSYGASISSMVRDVRKVLLGIKR